MQPRSGSQVDKYDDDEYSLQDEDRLPSRQSDRPVSQAETRSVRSQVSRLTRTPSPLIPSEASARYENEYDERREPSPIQEDDMDDQDFDDPKYQAHRNSLNLQHPQPRQGTTGRHQNKLETQAYYYDDVSGTNSDLSQRTVSDSDPLMFGSAGTAALARNRMSQATDPKSPASITSPNAGGYGGVRNSKDSGPLVPQKPAARPPKIHEPEPEPEWEPQYSNSGFSKRELQLQQPVR